MTTTILARNELHSLVGESALRRTLSSMIRRRVPPVDAEDVVQAALLDALAAERLPEDPADLARFIVGIARHKIADYHRRSKRERRSNDPEEPKTAPAPF